MDYLSHFKEYLFSQQGRTLQSVSIKNYLADVNKFILWYEHRYHISFKPEAITHDTIIEYKQFLSSTDKHYFQQSATPASVSSIERYMSSLRKFFMFLQFSKVIMHNPVIATNQQKRIDPFLLGQFKNYLYENKANYLTIKNYLLDIQLFLFWLRTTYPHQVSDSSLLTSLDQNIVSEYKRRLIQEKTAASTINRRLSSLRKYITFLQLNNNKNKPIIITNISYNNSSSQTNIDESTTSKKNEVIEYSSFGPIRFFQRLYYLMNFIYEKLVIIPLLYLISTSQYIIWQVSGRKIFVPVNNISPKLATYLETNSRKYSRWSRRTKQFSSYFFAPLHVETEKIESNMSKYINIYLSAEKHFKHISILLLIIILSTIFAYIYVAFHKTETNNSVLSAETSRRILSFQGKLFDAKHLPITHPAQVRFALYNDPDASISALLWQDTQTIHPQFDGSFQATLGDQTPLPESIFTENASLYLGTTIGTDNELRPREEIPTVSLSNNTQTLHGMTVLNEQSGTQRNVILALDSSGNLQIANSSPIFSATNGSITLTGETTIISTNQSSNGNIILSPDGSGEVDIQKAITNTSDSANGAVQIDDRLAITATSSSQAAVRIDQENTGLIIDASNSGLTKFTVNYLGAGMFASDLAVNGQNLTSSALTFNLLNTGVSELNIGGQATDISIGGAQGTTTIKSPQTDLYGDLLINGSTGITMDSPNANLYFNGTGNHTISASQGALLIQSPNISNGNISNQLTLNNTSSIIPQNSNGANNLGSNSSPFGNLYVNTVQTNSRLTVNTSLPAFRFAVSDNQIATATAYIANQSTNQTSSDLALQIGNLSPDSGNHFIDFLDGNGEVIGSIQGNGSNGITLKQNGIADFAEYLPKEDQEVIPFGAVVCFQTNGNISKCTNSYQNIAGVVSETPTILAGQDNGNGSVPVGLTGQIEVEVSTQNGLINFGDPISASTIPGVGVKAIHEGQIIGHALETYSNANPYLLGKILVLIQPSWYNPNVQLTNSGNLSISLTSTSQPQTQAQYKLVDAANNLINNFSAFSSLLSANIESGFFKTRDLLVSGNANFLGSLDAASIRTTQVATDSILIAGVRLQDYINKSIQQSQLDFANNHAASVLSLETNLISPIGSSSGIIVNGNIRTNGNATISGQLISSALQTQDATVSGTLRAHTIVADSIEGILPSSSSATYITNVTNVYQSATPSGQSNKNLQDSTTTSTTLSKNLNSTEIADKPIKPLLKDINVSSYSAQLSQVPEINTEQMSVNRSLLSNGQTTLSDTSITGVLAINANMLLSNDSIDVIGADLQIQPSRQGGVSFLDGLVSINTQGDLSVGGDASFAKNVTINGTINANVLSPLADNNLSVQLGTASADSHSQSFIINNSSGSDVLSINQQGDIQASGSGSFAQLVANTLTIVHGVQADSSGTNTIATTSAGNATIFKGQTERTIITPFVKKTSLIYITPTSDTNGLTPYIARQTDADIQAGIPSSFTIQVSSPTSRDIHINWWVIN